MKIKNDNIIIKYGKKTYEFHNLIFDSYIKKFIESQLSMENATKTSNKKYLDYILLKLDDPIGQKKEDDIVLNSDLNLMFFFISEIKQEVSENQIKIKYTYKINDYFNVVGESSEGSNSLSDFYGRKITAIAFNNFGITLSENVQRYPVCAILDTSNYDLYIQENQDISIVRQDTVSTDALFYTNNPDKIKGPAHLMPYPNEAIITPTTLTNSDNSGSIFGSKYSYGILHSIGLSTMPDYIDKEYIIGTDITIESTDTTILIKGIPANGVENSFVYPTNHLFPSNNLFLTRENYKYVILKYKMWQDVLSGTYENPVHTYTDTGCYYYQSIPIENLGEQELTIKYERR